MENNKINVERDIGIHVENKSASRRYFAFLFALYSITYMTKGCFNGSLADIVSEGILTKSETGLISAVFYLIYTPFQIIGGLAADRYSPEKLIKIGLIGGAVANAVIFFNQNYYVMLITWGLNAIVQFGLWPSIFKIMTSQLYQGDRKEMIFIMSLSATVGLLGTFVTAAVVPAWQYNFAISSVLLLLLAVILHFADKRLCRYAVRNESGEYPALNESAKITLPKNDISTFKLFMQSGFILMLIPVFVRSAVGQSVKSISPTFIMETYEVSSTTANLLNTLIIISGVLGTLGVRYLLAKRIKNEAFGVFVFMASALVLTALLMMSGELVSTIVILCAIAALTTAPSLFISYFNSKFSRYGKNATAAGVSNAAASMGVCMSSYGFTLLADLSGWGSVMISWCILLAVSSAALLIIIPISRRFDRNA